MLLLQHLQQLTILLKFNHCVIELLLLIRKLRKRKKKLRRWWVKPHLYPVMRNNFGAYNLICEYFAINDHEEFSNFLRMSVDDFEFLHGLVKNRLQKQANKRQPISTEIRLASTLHFLGHGGSVKSNAVIWKTGKSTMYLIISETCKVLSSILLPLYVRLPNRERWLQIADDYNILWNFPNCIGAIDGKHIQIKHPPNGGSLFFNYMKYESVVLMAICDAHSRFTYFNIGDYGSYSDSSIFGASDLLNRINNNMLDIPDPRQLPNSNLVSPYVFIGDEIFPLNKHLIKPYSRKLVQNDIDKIFNYRLSRARNTIECAFGILTSKWRILQGALTFELDTVTYIVSACISLHNYLISRKKPIILNENVFEGNFQEYTDRDFQPHTVRNTFRQYFSSVGAVEWQNRYI